MEQQMLFENLDEKLDGDTAVISTKWLSLQFDLHMCDAERTLTAYLKARHHLSAVFLLSGFLHNNEMLIKLVPHDKLDSATAEFASRPVQTIYSIQRQPCKSSTMLASVDPLLDLTTEALKKFITIPWTPPAESRQPSCDSENRPKPNVSPKPVEHIPSFISKINKTGKDEQITTKTVTNFFAPTSKKSTNTKSAHPCSEEKQSRPNIVGSTLSNRNNVPAADDDEEEIGRRPNAVRGSLAKRKRVIESDEDDNVDEQITVSPLKISANSPSPKKPAISSPDKSSTKSVKTKQRKSRGKNAVLAPDSEVDSPSFKPSPSAKAIKKLESPIKRTKGSKTTVSISDSSLQPTKSSSTNVGRTSDVPVEPIHPRAHHHAVKTFMDDDGFMVTEKVWESIPVDKIEDHNDNDEEHIVSTETSERTLSSVTDVNITTTKSATSKTKSVKAPATKHSRPSSKPVKSSNVKQTSLSAFLKKT